MTDYHLWRWCGSHHHLIVGNRCHFSIATEVGDFLVSTVGEYRPSGPESDMVTLGADPDSFYETMVFRVGSEVDVCGLRKVADWEEEVFQVRYPDAKWSNRGHMNLCLAADRNDGKWRA